MAGWSAAGLSSEHCTYIVTASLIDSGATPGLECFEPCEH